LQLRRSGHFVTLYINAFLLPPYPLEGPSGKAFLKNPLEGPSGKAHLKRGYSKKDEK
jgi:hypothetical protein